VRLGRTLLLAVVVAAVACTSNAVGETAASPDRLACPVHLDASVPRHHQRPGTEPQMVPGQPVALLACRYVGLNGPASPGTVARTARIAPAPTAALLNGYPLASETIHSCPSDTGGVILLDFGYLDGSNLVVRVNTSGCRYATNGDRTVDAGDIIGTLEQVLGHDNP
jgi:hypothetical protein